MKNAWLASLAATLATATADDVYTVTSTNYITPDCFSNAINTALAANPSGLSSGIPIHFVYANAGNAAETEDTIQTIVTSSQMLYVVSTDKTATQTVTLCNNNLCLTSVTSSVYPQYITTSAEVTYTTAGKKQASTIYEVDTETDNQTDDVTLTQKVSAEATVLTTAVTTTKTIFTATESPVHAYLPPVSKQTITKTERDPLITNAPVSKALETSINLSSYTTGVSIGKVAASNSTSSGNSTNLAAPILSSPVSSNSTSTIDLRLSSTYDAENTRVAAAYGNVSHAGTSVVPSTLVSLTSSLSPSPTKEFAATTSAPAGSASTLSPSISAPSSASVPANDDSVCGAGDLFQAISNDKPLSVFPRQDLPLALPLGVHNDGVPYETNKFYANLILGDQTGMTWSYPNGLYWLKLTYYGFGVQHTNVSNRVFGTGNSNNPDVPSYYLNPILNGELIISATDISKDSNFLTVTNHRSMSVLAQLSPSQNLGSNYIDIPIVQGMGFTTAIYHGDLIPELNTVVGIASLKQESSSALSSNTQKYRATLFNGVEWLVYVTLPSSSTKFNFDSSQSFKVTGSGAVDGLIIQLAVAPDSSQDAYYDQSAGMYVTDAAVQGSASCSSASYSFKYSTLGKSKGNQPIVFAFPHHVQSLSASTKQTSTGIKLASTTKGDMYAYLTDELQMTETLQPNVGFLPWTQNSKGSLTYTAEQLQLLAEVANSELAVDINETVQVVDSTYSSGKLLDKYAYILLIVNDVLKDEDVAKSTLQAMKDAFQPFFDNTQYYPFMYDTRYGGVTSTASQNGDTGADYGASYYNDHHFHYGYYVHAAAIVGYVDKKLGGTWAEDNKDWVNALIRDVANPSEDDTYFPVSRMFDWFSGHSWAGGLFASGDGKNEESSSEDYNFAYGMKMWGSVIGDGAMESRGDLMLSIMARAMNMYFYYSDDNTVQPALYIPNKVSGILFENKIAYTTYFGSPDKNPEYVHGIHMLPISPASSLIRGPTFVQQEWEEQISKFVGDVNSGWLGILKLNQALYDAKSSYEFFSSDNWNQNYLDNGQSRTWSLAFSGGIANSS